MIFRRSVLFLPALLAAALLFTGCGTTKPPCPICYEDEWSRDPFPGQPKQHTRTPTPEDFKNGAGLPAGTREFLGQSADHEPF